MRTIDTWPALEKWENLRMEFSAKRHKRLRLKGVTRRVCVDSDLYRSAKVQTETFSGCKLPSPYDEDKRFACTSTWHNCYPCT